MGANGGLPALTSTRPHTSSASSPGGCRAKPNAAAGAAAVSRPNARAAAAPTDLSSGEPPASHAT
eukprot:6133519-Lingulodinium_polyedra.AAC.1